MEKNAPDLGVSGGNGNYFPWSVTGIQWSCTDTEFLEVPDPFHIMYAYTVNILFFLLKAY